MNKYNCSHCDKEFKRKRSEIRTKTPCCSTKCAADFRRKLKEKECPICGKTFLKNTVTCSRECWAVNHSSWVRKNQSGPNNPFYGKHHTEESKRKMSEAPRIGFIPHNKGKRKKRDFVPSSKRGAQWAKIKEATMQRDNNLCLICGNPGEVVHHIVPLRDCREHRLNNLITLCHKCHKKTYGKEYKFVNYFKGMLLQHANGENPEVGNPVASIKETRERLTKPSRPDEYTVRSAHIT